MRSLSKYFLTALIVAVLIGTTACTAKTSTSTTVLTTATTATTTTSIVNTSTTNPTTSATTKVTTTTAVTGSAPPEVTQYAADWPLANKDYANSRATKDSTITSSNVKNLGVAWAMPIPGSGNFGAAACTPIIQGNSVFFQDLALNTFSIDKTTGAVKWEFPVNTGDVGPAGAAVGYGKVFVPYDPFNVAALDMNTGKLAWSQSISNANTIGIDIQPTVWNNTVFASSVPGSSSSFYSGGAYGTFFGLDQSTGKIQWRWDTVDDPKGLWGHPEVNSGGGSWYPAAIDVKTGISFWGVGNPAPYPGTKDFPDGSSHPGPNLYTDSLVAINSQTGKLQWFNQVWAHDISDYDLQISPMLASANWGGVQQDIVIGAGKMGRVYAFNRQNGNLLWDCEVGKHQNDTLLNHTPPAGQTSIEVYPGVFGGVETPMAYADGVVYVAANNVATNYTPTGIASLGQTGTGDLVAIDVNIGRILWDAPLPSPEYGAATVVNDLVFTATQDGTIYAFKRDTGAQVWSYKAPAGINAWPAVSGDMIIWPCGVGGTPVLLALKLGATAPVLSIARPVAGSTIPAGDITVNAAALNFSVVDKQGQANNAGEGHLHFYLDVDAPTTAGQPAIPTSGTWAHVSGTSYTFPKVAAGAHTISVELVNNDHTPLNPPVVQKISINVQDNVPSVQITTPANRAVVQPGSFTMTVQLTNFTVATGTGVPNAANSGKLVYYVDGAIPEVPGQPATTSTSTTSTSTSQTFQMLAGTHTYSVQLVNNDLTSLPIPAVATIVITNSLAPVSSGP